MQTLDSRLSEGAIAESIRRLFAERRMEVVEETDRSFNIACDGSLDGLGSDGWVTLGEMVRNIVGPVLGMLD